MKDCNNLREFKMITKKECQRCGKKWWPRDIGRPSNCPKCRTAKWDILKGDNEPGPKRKYTPVNKKI